MTRPIDVYNACVALGNLAVECVGKTFNYVEANRLVAIIDSVDPNVMIASGYLPKTTLMSDRIYGWQKTVKSSAGQLNRNSITTRTAPSIETQTGYRRMYKYAICQDIEVLEKITKYDFNLLCEGFIEYLADRGIIGVGTAENITVEQHIDIIQNWSDDEILNGEFYSESISGYRYTPEERKTTLRIHRIMKGKIQDAWEIFLLDVNS